MGLEPMIRVAAAPPRTAETSPGAVFARAVRAHWRFVALITVLATLAAALALALRAPRYEARAQILITPAAQDDETFVGLDVLRDTGEPTRTAQTAAALLESTDAAQVVARQLGDEWNESKVLEAVDVAPQGESDVLGVTAVAESPELAARLANEFARAAVATRFERLNGQLRARIEQLRAQSRAVSGTGSEAELDLAQQVNKLETVRASGRDPTVGLAQTAAPSTTRLGAPASLVGLIAVLTGLVLGAIGAVGLEVVSGRVRDEQELVSLYPLPVLARVPPLPRALRKRGSLGPFDLPPAAGEAFRALRVELEQRARGSRVVMIASASLDDGKTTTTAGLAAVLVQADYRVVLIDLDLRQPELAGLFGVDPEHGMSAVLASVGDPTDLLVESPYMPGLRILPARLSDAGFADALGRQLPEVLSAVRALADFVIIDTSPLGAVSDAMRFVGQVDDVVLVARPGHTRRQELEHVRDALERSGARPAGLVVIGQAARSSGLSIYDSAPLPRLPVTIRSE